MKETPFEILTCSNPQFTLLVVRDKNMTSPVATAVVLTVTVPLDILAVPPILALAPPFTDNPCPAVLQLTPAAPNTPVDALNTKLALFNGCNDWLPDAEIKSGKQVVSDASFTDCIV